MFNKIKNVLLIISFILLVLTIFVQSYHHESKTIEIKDENALYTSKYDNLNKEKDRLLKEAENTKNNYEKKIESLQLQNDALKDKIAKQTDQRKKVFLTFDDGPSRNTIRILDTLKKYNVKATFFPNGNDSAFAKKTYKRIIDEGHVLGNHTYSHDYSKIYSSLESFEKDFNEMQELFSSTVGFEPSIYRFPGGSSNTIHRNYGKKGLPAEIARKFEEKGYTYYDWNVDSKDASKVVQSEDVIVRSVLSGVRNHKQSIVLFHDSSAKTTTATALPTIIRTLKKQNYTFETLHEKSFNIQFLEK